MVSRCFRLGSPTPSSPAPTSYPPLLPLTTLFFAPRSTSPSKTSSLSPALIGCIVAIVILASLSTAAAWLALHVHHCRRSGCWACSTITCSARSRNRTIPANGHGFPGLQTQRGAYPEASRVGVYLFEPFTQDSWTSSQTPFPSLAPPPRLYTHRPQHSETTMSNSVVSMQRPVTSSISNNRTPALGVVDPYYSPHKFTRPPERRVTHSGGALGRGSNLSDISIITLPSFVEHESRDSTPSPALALPDPPAIDGMRPLPLPRRSSLSHPSRSRGGIASTTTPTAPSWETPLGRDVPSSSLSVPDRQLHLPAHRARSSSQQAGVRRGLATAKPTSVAQAEVVGIAQPGTPETSMQPRTNRLRPDGLPPLKIPGRTLPFLGDYDSLSTRHQPSSFEKRGAGLIPQDSSQPVPSRPAQFINPGATEPSPPYRPPVLGFQNSPSSYSSPEERRVRGVSQAGSSTSTVPSVSAFPSPPDFTPGSGDNALSTARNYSTSGWLFPPTPLWENGPVRSVETASPNEGQASMSPLPDADQPILAVISRSSRRLHPAFTDGDHMPGVFSRASSMRRLSRIPLGPRSPMSDRSASLRRWTQSPSV